MSLWFGVAACASATAADAPLRLATGPADGAYAIIGRALETIFSKTLTDVDVRLITTNGSRENADLLRQGRADLAIIQHDVLIQLRDSKASNDIRIRMVIGLVREPVQVVAVAALAGDGVRALAGRRVCVGNPSSGSYCTATTMLAALGLECEQIEAASFSEAANKLRRGDVAAVVFVSPPPSPHLASLLSDTRFTLLAFDNDELNQIHQSQPGYASASIQPHTYPHQRLDVATASVATGLVARAGMDADMVERVTHAILLDAARPESMLRRALPQSEIGLMVDLAVRGPLPMHAGARRVIDSLPQWRRWSGYQQWLHWLLGVLIVGVVLWFAYRPSTRHCLLNGLARARSGPWLRAVRRIAFHPVLWRIVRTGGLLVLIWLAGSLLMYQCEHNANIYFRDLRMSSLSILVYLFSGLEDRAPVTIGGWAGSTVMLLAGLLITAYITGQFASEIVSQTLGVIRMHNNAARDSLLIVGWNARGQRVVDELLAAFEEGQRQCAISVLTEAPVEQRRAAGMEAQGVTFVSAHTFDKKALMRLGAQRARSVVILADDEAEDPDALTALVVLAVRGICREQGIAEEDQPTICAEVKNHRKMELIRDAGATQVVCHEDFGLGVLVQSVFNTDVTKVYHGLLSYSPDTCEVYVLTSTDDDPTADFPPDVWQQRLEGKSFDEAVTLFRRWGERDNPTVLIGIDRDGQVTLSPRSPFALQQGDRLIVIAWRRPVVARFVDFE